MELADSVNRVHKTLIEFSNSDRRLAASGKPARSGAAEQSRVQLARDYLAKRREHQAAIEDCEKAFEEADDAG